MTETFLSDLLSEQLIRLIISLFGGVLFWIILKIIIRKTLNFAANELEQHESTEDVGNKVKGS